jgi:hypothetical protein
MANAAIEPWSSSASNERTDSNSVRATASHHDSLSPQTTTQQRRKQQIHSVTEQLPTAYSHSATAWVKTNRLAKANTTGLLIGHPARYPNKEKSRSANLADPTTQPALQHP